MENLIKMDDLGGPPLFLETPIYDHQKSKVVQDRTLFFVGFKYLWDASPTPTWGDGGTPPFTSTPDPSIGTTCAPDIAVQPNMSCISKPLDCHMSILTRQNSPTGEGKLDCSRKVWVKFPEILWKQRDLLLLFQAVLFHMFLGPYSQNPPTVWQNSRKKTGIETGSIKNATTCFSTFETYITAPARTTISQTIVGVVLDLNFGFWAHKHVRCITQRFLQHASFSSSSPLAFKKVTLFSKTRKASKTKSRVDAHRI